MTKKNPEPRQPRRAPAKRPKTRKAVARRLTTALAAGKVDLFFETIADTVRAEGADRIAKKAGLSQKALDAAFSPEVKSEFAAALSIIQAIGGRISIKAEAA